MKKNYLLTSFLTVGVLATGICVTAGRYAAPRLYAAAADEEEMPGQVPNKAENLVVTVPEDGSHTVHFEFDAPTGVMGNLSNAGWLRYELSEANKYPKIVYAEGDCDYGQHVSFDAEIPSGNHKFSLTMVNPKGNSSPVNYPSGLYDYVYVGVGVPTAPKNVVLTGEGNSVTLTWDKVTTPTNTTAPFDPSKITYKVVRTPDEVTVAENLTNNTYSGTLPEVTEPTGYRFNVYAVNGVETSSPTLSNAYAVGSATPAWDIELNTINNVDVFTNIDANADGVKWQWSVTSKIATIDNGSSAYGFKNDYLVSPPLILEAGKLYPIEVGVSSYSKNQTEKFEVVGGVAATKEALNQKVIETTSVCTPSHNEPVRLTGFYLAPTDGVNYIAIHAMTDASAYTAGANYFKIGEGIVNSAPEGISDLVITSDPDIAPPTAEISFKAPATAISGEALSSLTKIEVRRDGELIKTFENPVPGAVR